MISSVKVRIVIALVSPVGLVFSLVSTNGTKSPPTRSVLAIFPSSDIFSFDILPFHYKYRGGKNIYELFGFITTNYNITEHNILYNDCFCYSEKPAAARPYLAVPTPVVSVATTPVLLTRLVIETPTPANPYPNIALSVP